MAKNFNELRKRMSPERQQRNEEAATRELLSMSLQELRTSITSFNQEDVAKLLEVTQGYVSKLERQDDMPLSKLYAYVEALGGQLQIRAMFPEQTVEIAQFGDVGKLHEAMKKKSA